MIREFFKVYKLVYNYNSFKSIYFNFIVIISTFLEGISIGIIFPLLDLTINKNKENIIFDLFPFINLENPNYILKMSDYKKDDWCDVLDGLYWKFIDINKDFLGKNPRLSLMVNSLKKIDEERRKYIFKQAEIFIEKNTYS